MILYILLSGVPPFWGESEQQIFDAILKGNLDFQSEPWPQISSEAKDCVKQMLQQVLNLLPLLYEGHFWQCVWYGMQPLFIHSIAVQDQDSAG